MKRELLEGTRTAAWLALAFVTGGILGAVALALALGLGLSLPVSAVTTVIGVVLGYFAGYWKDRQERRRRLRAVAETLREDVRRIRRELGTPPKDREVPLVVDSQTAGYGPDRAVVQLDAIPPRVHPWFDSVVHQIGEASVPAVTLFLELDTDLHNYDARVKQLRTARADTTEKQAAFDAYAHITQALDMSGTLAREAADRAANLARLNLEATEKQAWTVLRACHRTLDALEGELTAVLTGRGGSRAVTVAATASHAAAEPFVSTGR